MREIKSEAELDEAILQLQARQAGEEDELKEQFRRAVDSVKPINLIKRTIKDAMHSSELKDDFINSALGLATGFISKKLYVGFSGGPIKKIIGSAIMMAVSNLVSNHPDLIKSIGKNIWEIFGAGKKNGTAESIKKEEPE